MRLKFFAILHHSILMVGRTIRNYMMLSMTVVLSFSILLGVSVVYRFQSL